MDYGRALKTLRGARKLEQRDLAEKAGLDASYISLIETRKRIPSTSALTAIAQALGVPAYLLMILASEKDDLHGVSAEVAEHIGSALLRAVLASDVEVEYGGSVSKDTSIRPRRRKAAPRVSARKKPSRP